MPHLRRTLAASTLLALAATGCSDETTAPPVDACAYHEAIDDTPAPPITTPRWAFEPWISKDISDGADTAEFVKGFQDRNIPVGVLVLDSPWETHYNTFIPNEERYPEFEKMVTDLRGDGIRTVLWMTQMVNSTSFDLEIGGDAYSGPSPNYEEGVECGFFVNEAAGYGWWKGVGAGVDFFNPDAVGWWHRQQDALFDMGVAGFKLDFGDSYITTPTVQTFAGEVSHQEYSEAYYRDFFAYGAAKVGLEEFVTMVRPYDKSYEFEGRFFARPEHTSVGWVGDNRRDWIGLEDALDHMFRSAEADYVVIGSDIGGYLDRDDRDLTDQVPFDTLNFQRWTALGAMTPFMQLHGRSNIAPWTVPDEPEETAAIYRYWATLHHEMVPFWYSLAEEAYANGGPIMHPIGTLDDWAGDYRFIAGEAFLIAPILDATGIRDVPLPAGARWYDWWAPDTDPLDGGQTLSDYDSTDTQRIPMFVREGAIVPLVDASTETGLGSDAAQGLLTVLVYPGASESSFALHEEDGSTTTITASTDTVTLSQAIGATYLKLRRETAPTGVDAGASLSEVADRAALDAADSGWFYEASTRSVWVKVAASTSPVTVTTSGG